MHGGEMCLESELGIGTTISFRLPLDPLPIAALDSDGWRRWFSPYHQYEGHTGRSAAPAPSVVPQFVLVEEGHVLQRLFGRYVHDVSVVAVDNVSKAIERLQDSPAQALIVNAPGGEPVSTSEDRLSKLPHGTPAITCCVPGEEETIRQMGVERYLVKPITRQRLLSILEDLEEQVNTVLVVDDEPEVLQLFARLLSSSGRNYRVLRAKSGQRALGLLRERRPDVMLLDLFMPGMDGFQVLLAKEEDPSIRDIPTIVISARDPYGESIVTKSLTVRRDGGLSARELLACIRDISEILAPSERPGRRVPPESRAA
jgi:CheY-like chemotaxis protein